MTNTTPSDRGAGLDPEILALPHVRGARRPVKVVQHPAFRGPAHRSAARVHVVPLRVVSLNGTTAAPDGRRIAAVLRLVVLSGLPAA